MIWYTKYFIFVNLFLLSVNVLELKVSLVAILFYILAKWALTNLYCICDRDTGMADGLADDYLWTNFSYVRLLHTHQVVNH